MAGVGRRVADGARRLRFNRRLRSDRPPPMSVSHPPPTVSADQAVPALRRAGHAVLLPAELPRAVGVGISDLQALNAAWDDLPPDRYLRDGGRYRRRRHACFELRRGAVVAAPHRAHWQPVEYNALHGGLERWFEPITAATLAAATWPRLLAGLAALCSAVRGTADADAEPWFVEAHQFRIDTTDGIGRPTPEGAHRDGVDFVAVALVGRSAVKGGETRVFDAEGPNGIRFTLTEPWTLLLLDDARVVHETTPIQPLNAARAAPGHRDTLVLTFRRGGFQGPPGAG